MMHTLLFALAFVGQTNTAFAPAEVEGRTWRAHWREGGFDAVTSLYVFYQQLGITITYEGLAEDDRLISQPTFADVVQNANRNGAAVSLRKCTLAELGQVPLPAIIHLDSERESDVGEFVVLIVKTGDTWTTVNGLQGTIGTIDANTLLRHWSGFVMFAPAGFQWIEICGAGGLGLMLGVSIRFANSRRFLRSRGEEE